MADNLPQGGLAGLGASPSAPGTPDTSDALSSSDESFTLLLQQEVEARLAAPATAWTAAAQPLQPSTTPGVLTQSMHAGRV